MASSNPPRTPKYRRQKRPSSGDQAFVVLDGQRYYLGPYGSTESLQRYHQVLAEWTAGGGQVRTAGSAITITELCARFWRHACNFYRKPNGQHTTTLDNYRQCLRPLRQLYGDTCVADFGPRALKAVRQNMINRGWCRTHINRQISRVRSLFRWAAAEELVPASVHHALQTLTGLKCGRTSAPESEPVKPVPEAQIDAIEPHVSRQVWALVQLQLFTAARSSELVVLRAIDLDTTGKIWLYTPTDHKTAHHGRQRTIYFGPRAQAIIRPFLAQRAIDAFLFSPREAEQERHASSPSHRRANQKPNACKTSRTIGDHYTAATYRRAIERGCRTADVPAWSPHRLRHTAGTYVRKEFGLEAAQLILGHARADVTQIYAEVDHNKALAIAAKVG